MHPILWFLSGLVLGGATVFAFMQIAAQLASDAAAARRARRRRVLGLEERPAPQPGAIGHARITSGNFKREVRGL